MVRVRPRFRKNPLRYEASAITRDEVGAYKPYLWEQSVFDNVRTLRFNFRPKIVTRVGVVSIIDSDLNTNYRNISFHLLACNVSRMDPHQNCERRAGKLLCSKVCKNARANSVPNVGRHCRQLTEPCRNGSNSETV